MNPCGTPWNFKLGSKDIRSKIVNIDKIYDISSLFFNQIQLICHGAA